MQWRVRFDVLGSHVHCALFCALAANATYAKCGDFVVRKGDEFSDLVRNFSGAEFIGNDPKVGCLIASQND